jgi:hypothetical protein
MWEPLRPTLSSDSDANDESDEEEAERGKHLEQERLDVRVLHVGVGVDQNAIGSTQNHPNKRRDNDNGDRLGSARALTKADASHLKHIASEEDQPGSLGVSLRPI